MNPEYEFRERCVVLAEYIIEKGSTVRDTAAKFGISKSTVHKDVTDRLMKINPALHKSVKAVLEKNKAERHLRGGEATREKYKLLAEVHMADKRRGKELIPHALRDKTDGF